MTKYLWLRPRHASHAHAFHGTKVDGAREAYDREDHDDSWLPIQMWPVERKCGSFDFAALGKPDGALCPFCMRAVRRDWLMDRLRDGVLIVSSARWAARVALHWVEHRLWGRP